jgi:hypothetical protein
MLSGIMLSLAIISGLMTTEALHQSFKNDDLNIQLYEMTNDNKELRIQLQSLLVFKNVELGDSFRSKQRKESRYVF